MADIVVRLVKGAKANTTPPSGMAGRPAQQTPLTYHIRNLDSLSVGQSIPTIANPIPESSDEENILVKIMGNQTTIDVSYTLVTETTSYLEEVVIENKSFGIPSIPASASQYLADDQLRFLMNLFAPRSFDIGYHIFLGSDVNTTTAPGVSPPSPPFKASNAFTDTTLLGDGVTTVGTVNKKYWNSTSFKRMGILGNMTYTKMGTEPVTYRVTLHFIAGDSIGGL